jgi:hypothetical protein
VSSVVPNAHFSQDELASVVKREPAVQCKTGKSADADYAALLEKRLRKLDWTVQDEIYDLLNDRVQASSSAFRHRDWRVVVLVEVPGGEMTDAPTKGKLARGYSSKKGRLAGSTIWNPKPRMPITEYRLVLRGTETKANDEGWGYHNRYSRPWRDADEKEYGGGCSGVAEGRKRDSCISDKYLDF